MRIKEEKYNDFLVKLGVGFIMRKAALSGTPTMEISKDGNKWTMVTKSPFITTDMTSNIELGVPFEEITTDGRKCKTTITMEGDNKLITNQVATEEGKKSVKVIREFSDEGIDVQMICGDVISKQFFKRK